MTVRTARIDYGIDAPGVIRNLALIGIGSLVAGLTALYFGSGNLLWGFRFAFFSIAFFFTSLPFDDESFDVVLSNLCIHNIPGASGRRRAMEEAARVLKPGGTVVVSDFKHTAVHANHFRDAGLFPVERRGPFWLDTFPPLRIVVAQKGVFPS